MLLKISKLAGPVLPGQSFRAADGRTGPEGIRIFAVCDRDEPEVELPDFDQIEFQLRQQKMSMFARRFLRDLRRDGIIEFR